jgi:hypothetical protein
MSSFYVRMSGKIFGPFTNDQLQQMRTAGRINGQTEISTDRTAWMPAATVLGTNDVSVTNAPQVPTGVGARVAQPIPTASDTKKYLAALRNNTRYPFYRTTILIYSILGYVGAALPIVALVGKVLWLGLSSVEVIEPIGAVIGSGLIAAFVTLFREIFSMYGDLVDSTIDHHYRESSS